MLAASHYIVLCRVSRDGDPHAVRDGCRFQGSLTVNKVAGNFHITAGKCVSLITRCYQLTY